MVNLHAFESFLVIILITWTPNLLSHRQSTLSIATSTFNFLKQSERIKTSSKSVNLKVKYQPKFLSPTILYVPTTVSSYELNICISHANPMGTLKLFTDLKNWLKTTNDSSSDYNNEISRKNTLLDREDELIIKKLEKKGVNPNVLTYKIKNIDDESKFPQTFICEAENSGVGWVQL